MRRSTSEVRELLLKAAHDCFQDKGYHATSTREIAQRAGVTEPMLFRHFGSKSALFERAVFDPFVEFIADFIVRASDLDAAAAKAPQLARHFVGGFFRIFVDHRDLIVTMLGQQDEGGQPRLAASVALDAQFDAFAEVVDSFVSVEGEQIMDAGLAIRFTLSFLLGTALADGHLFSLSEGDRSPDEVVQEMTDFVLRAIGHRIV
ncbi:helix-turn-helix domain-containing protein [Sporichthya brevicatena]|uniref:TetR/AcrR family transcriptional regulator n=1 Tax=Sporichthya brevicatena TaxID=171442 RepID=UPI0031DB4F90